MLHESSDRYVQSAYSFDDRQKNAGSDLGYDANNWNTFAELGWVGVPFSESECGFVCVAF